MPTYQKQKGNMDNNDDHFLNISYHSTEIRSNIGAVRLSEYLFYANGKKTIDNCHIFNLRHTEAR